MALSAYLQFGSNITRRYFKEYLVSDCHVIHRRRYNKFCPEGAATCERLEVSVVCPGRDDLELYEWYDTQNAQEGRIIINTTTTKESDGTAEHIIYFEDARCFSLTEYYDASTTRRRMLKLAVEAGKITVDDTEIKRY